MMWSVYDYVRLKITERNGGSGGKKAVIKFTVANN